MHRGETLPLVPWTGGLNTVTDKANLNPQQLTRAENIELEFDGTRRTRGGVAKFNQTPVIDTE